MSEVQDLFVLVWFPGIGFGQVHAPEGSANEPPNREALQTFADCACRALRGEKAMISVHTRGSAEEHEPGPEGMVRGLMCCYGDARGRGEKALKKLDQLDAPLGGVLYEVPRELLEHLVDGSETLERFRRPGGECFGNIDAIRGELRGFVDTLQRT
jgi:hypothetical protein